MSPIRIAVDAAGGDHGTPVILDGVLLARERWPGEFTATLCGDNGTIERALGDRGVSLPCDGLVVEHCPDSIGPADPPAQAWRKRGGAPAVRSIALQAEGLVDASVGAGDTGVFMAAANFLLGRTEGAARAALAATVPTTAGSPALLLDVGASMDCRPEHLLAFGAMGCEYMRGFYGTDEPRVALLNVGAEPKKGPKKVCAAARMMADEIRGFAGYIEGSHVLSGDADVIVCDGFAGNVLLKVCQSFYALTESVLASRPDTLNTVKQTMAILNAESYGAVPLLGIDGVVLKAHGNSSAHAIANAVGTTLDVVNRGVMPVAAAS